ncbi:MAG: cytidyltransferase [Legionellales bacterium]|nr:cytidyltransferase [Legionellales bacterium]|tara:strand:+ start:189 stop:563 length:375 start_codon:yes stop_codon:yes gene_type:complete
MFDWKKPTVQLLGRWQPWHTGHTALFEQALLETGQVVVMVRDMPQDEDNPFDYETVWHKIRDSLQAAGHMYTEQYIIMRVPNIVDISYGREVGYTLTERDLGSTIHEVSSTKIRDEMRLTGELD